MRRVCVGLLRDRHEAEDAAQQTFLSAYRALVEGTEPREPAAWLATIARNECLLRIRSRMRAPVATPLEEEAGPDDVHREAVTRSHAAKLWREISSLPQQQRDAVILREFAGLSYDELAVALGISKPAVESLLFRARGRLRTRLEAAFASLNLAGAASAIAEAATRLVGSGAAQPVAAKIVAAGAAAALVGGGTAVVADHVVPPARHATARRPPARVAAPSTSAAAASVPVFAIAPQPREAPHLVAAAAEPRRARHGGEDGLARAGVRREDGGRSETEKRPTRAQDGDARGGGERVTTADRATGDGGERGDGRATTTTTTSARVDGGDGGSGSGRDGSRDGGESSPQTTTGETAPAPTTTSSGDTSTAPAATIPLTTTVEAAPTTVPTPTVATDGGGTRTGSDG